MGGYNLLSKMQQAVLFESGAAIALGLVEGVTSKVKFGHCPDSLDVATDVWEYGATQPIYVFPDDAGETVELVSTDVNDTQIITVQGLDENGLEQSVNVNLTGTTPVTLAGLWISVDRSFNNNGTVTLGDWLVRGTVSGNVFAYVDQREQQTTQAIYMVPVDKYALIVNVSTAINKSTNQDASAIATLKSQLPNNVFRTNIKYGISKKGTSNISSDLVIPVLYPPLTRIKITILPDTTDMDMSAEFSMKLIDVDLMGTLGGGA